MKSPPELIDEATVVRVADLAFATPTGRTKHVIGSDVVGDFAALAIAKYDSDPGYYLFYCDSAWKALTDTYHSTLEAAVEQANFEFDALDFVDPGAWSAD